MGGHIKKATSGVRAGLEAELTANPDDEGLRLVLADKLASAGDPRGELIVVQSKRTREPKDAALAARERELLDIVRGDLPPEIRVTWRLGYIHRAEISDDEGVATFLASENARYLRELKIDVRDEDPVEDPRPSERVLEKLGARRRPTLQTLTIKRRHFDDNYPFEERDRAVDTTSLWAKLPALRHLALDGVDIVTSLDHPRLQTLTLDDRPIHPDARWTLPKLEWIDWSCYWTSSGDAVDSSAQTFDPLWQQKLPALRDLTVRASITEEILTIDRPKAAAFIRKLARLRASLSMFGSYEDVIGHARTLRHLTRLVLLDAESDCDEREELERVLPMIQLDEGQDETRGRIA